MFFDRFFIIKRLNNFIYWNQIDKTTRFSFSNDQNILKLSQQMILINLECQSLGLYIYENNTTVVNHVYSTQIGLCQNIFTNTKCFSLNKMQQQQQNNFYKASKKFQFQRFLNSIFSSNLKKREIRSDLLLDVKLYRKFFNNNDSSEIQSFLKIDLANYFSRLDKIMLLRTLKTGNNSLTGISMNYLANKTSETGFIMRIIKASNLTLNGLDVCITNFVSF